MGASMVNARPREVQPISIPARQDRPIADRVVVTMQAYRLAQVIKLDLQVRKHEHQAIDLVDHTHPVCAGTPEVFDAGHAEADTLSGSGDVGATSAGAAIGLATWAPWLAACRDAGFVGAW
jgi:hypothetical protein